MSRFTTIRALNDLAEMAATKNDDATQKWATDKASVLLSRFEQDWWMPERGLYADSLALKPKTADQSSGGTRYRGHHEVAAPVLDQRHPDGDQLSLE